MATREVPVKKKVDMKCIQVNVFKNIARMAGRLFISCYISALELIYTP